MRGPGPWPCPWALWGVVPLARPCLFGFCPIWCCEVTLISPFHRRENGLGGVRFQMPHSHCIWLPPGPAVLVKTEMLGSCSWRVLPDSAWDGSEVPSFKAPTVRASYGLCPQSHAREALAAAGFELRAAGSGSTIAQVPLR